MASVIGIRAHRPTEAVARLHGEVSRALPDVHVVVVADQMRGAVAQPWPTSYDMIPITDEFLRSAGLRTDLVDAGWRCGDYAHYVLHQALDPDHAWLVEPDVRFLGMDLGAFLGGLDMSTADLVAADLLPAPDWLWSHQLTSRGVETPWRCFFPLTRLSRAAVGASLELRLRLQGIDNHFGQPNDEGIVATAVMTAGLTAADLRLLEPDAFTHFHHRPRLHHDVVAAHSPGPSVLHPSLSAAEFTRSVRRECLRAVRDDLREGPTGGRRGPLRTVETLGDFALLTNHEEAIHRQFFGEPDLQSGHYGEPYRRDVLQRLPLDARAIVALSRQYIRLSINRQNARGR